MLNLNQPKYFHLTVPVHRRPVRNVQRIAFDVKKRHYFRKCSEPYFFHSKHSKSSRSVQRSQNVPRLTQLLASGATEVGLRHLRRVLKLSVVAPLNSTPVFWKIDIQAKTPPAFQAKWVKHFCSKNASKFPVESSWTTRFKIIDNLEWIRKRPDVGLLTKFRWRSRHHSVKKTRRKKVWPNLLTFGSLDLFPFVVF